MTTIIDQLPPDIAQQLHPDHRKNEEEYWRVRDQLLPQYSGQWIGYANQQVVASGTSRVTVFHAAEATGQHPFVICVGNEHVPCRIRRVSFPYDTGYPFEALPIVSDEFRSQSTQTRCRTRPCDSRHGSRCDGVTLGGLPTTATHSLLWDAECCERHLRKLNHYIGIPGLGFPRWAGTSVYSSDRFQRFGADSRM
jgi:hypothetical protein